MLDHRAANPNLIVAVLNSVRLAGSAGVTRGAVSTRTGAEETLDWILNEDQRTVYNADARAQVGLEGYIKDAKTKMLFEMDLLKFRNRLLVEHGKVWPLVEGYTAVNPEDRARRSEALLEEILWRPLKTK
jgi:hypothetical protein